MMWCAPAVGTLAAQCAFFRGASRVVLIDREADRLQFAKDRIPKLETLNFANQKARPSVTPATSVSTLLHPRAADVCKPLGHSHHGSFVVLSHVILSAFPSWKPSKLPTRRRACLPTLHLRQQLIAPTRINNVELPGLIAMCRICDLLMSS